MNQLDFKDRVAVITGGAVGIGFAVAQRLVASGARVSLWDRDTAALAKSKSALGPETDTRVVDVADAGSVDAAARATASDLSRIDVLVCSAGITGPNVPLAEYPLDAWRQVIDVNLNGLFYCNRAIVPIMQQRDYGRIVNIASVAGKEGNPNASAYSTSTSCCRKYRWAALAWSRKSRRWSRGCAARTARSRRVRCSISPAAAQRIEVFRSW